MADKVNLVSPDGRIISAHPSKVDAAVKAGYTLSETPAAPAMDAAPVDVAAPIPGTDPAPVVDTQSAAPDTVEVIAPDGRKLNIHPSKLETATAAGYMTPEAAEHDDAGLAFMQGVSRYAGGDLIREGLNKAETYAQDKMIDAGIVDPQIAKDYDLFQGRDDVALNKQYNPRAAGAGEVVGVVGQALVPGAMAARGAGAVATPASLINASTAKLGEFAAKRVASGVTGPGLMSNMVRKGAELAAQGAAEGAVYGTATALNDAFLAKDYDSIAEKTWAGATGGAAIGAAAAPLFGGAFALGGKVVRKLAGSADDVVDDVAGTVARDPVEEAAAEAAEKVELDNTIMTQVDEASKLSQSLDGDASAELEMAFEPIYQSQGALVASDVAESEMGRIARAAKQAKAAAGGFENAHQEVVARAGDNMDRFMFIRDKLAKSAGKAAKRADARKLNAEFEGTPFAPAEPMSALDAFGAALDDIAPDKESLTFLASGGGATAVNNLRKALAGAKSKVAKYAAAGRVGDVASAVDDFKSQADAITKNVKNSDVRSMLSGSDEQTGITNILRKHLEDESIYGQYGVNQRRVNATWHESINREQDDLLSGITYRSGDDSATQYQRLRQFNRDSFGSFLDGIGGARYENIKPKEIAFRKMLRAGEVDMMNRANTWGSKADQALAAELRALRESVESDISLVALSKRDMNNWKALVASADDIAVVGSAVKSTLKLGQNIAGKVDSTTQRGTLINAKATAASEMSVTQRARKAAIKTQSRIVKAPATFVATAMSGKRASLTGAADAITVIQARRMAAEAAELQVPGSAAQARMEESLSDIGQSDPELAESMARKNMERAAYLATKATELQGNPHGHAQLMRYASAVSDPAGALERISGGNGQPEDLETMQAVYPSMWGEFVAEAVAELDAKDADLGARARASRTIGVPMDPRMSPDSIGWFQQRMPGAEGATGSGPTPDMQGSMAPTTGDRVGALGR